MGIFNRNRSDTDNPEMTGKSNTNSMVGYESSPEFYTEEDLSAEPYDFEQEHHINQDLGQEIGMENFAFPEEEFESEVESAPVFQKPVQEPVRQPAYRNPFKHPQSAPVQKKMQPARSIPRTRSLAAPVPAPVAPVAQKKPLYGIDAAIALMRELPETEDVTILITIVKKTLESTGIGVSEIISDAEKKQAHIQSRTQKLESEIRELEEQISHRTREIETLMRDLRETEQVKELLELAEMPKPTKFSMGSKNVHYENALCD